MVVHVVLFKLKDRSPGAIARAAEVLGGLEGKVPVIRKIDVGVDVLRSGRSYDIALSVRLDSLSDLEAYQAHPST
ncbi:MAG: Dabb family protein [Deltaproteobacteria bacterium]|nr:Dabb family protein [Deltaproteobacteria bacterium]